MFSVWWSCLRSRIVVLNRASVDCRIYWIYFWPLKVRSSAHLLVLIGRRRWASQRLASDLCIKYLLSRQQSQSQTEASWPSASTEPLIILSIQCLRNNLLRELLLKKFKFRRCVWLWVVCPIWSLYSWPWNICGVSEISSLSCTLANKIVGGPVFDTRLYRDNIKKNEEVSWILVEDESGWWMDREGIRRKHFRWKWNVDTVMICS